MKKTEILLAIVMLAVLVGMQLPSKAMAQMNGPKVYEAANGEIFPVTDPAAIATLKARAKKTTANPIPDCGLIVLAPKITRATDMKAAEKKTINLYVCKSGTEPYCITQAGKRVCWP